jgi:hypothetical protein
MQGFLYRDGGPPRLAQLIFYNYLGIAFYILFKGYL